MIDHFLILRTTIFRSFIFIFSSDGQRRRFTSSIDRHFLRSIRTKEKGQSLSSMEFASDAKQLRVKQNQKVKKKKRNPSLFGNTIFKRSRLTTVVSSICRPIDEKLNDRKTMIDRGDQFRSHFSELGKKEKIFSSN